jgi:hypothetical protein
VAGTELQGLLEAGLGMVEVAAARVGDPQVEVRRRRVRRPLDDLEEDGDAGW